MTVDVEAFLDRWVYDVEHKLQSRLAALAGDLHCGDEEAEKKAAKEASEILDLLYGAVKPVSREERQGTIKQELVNYGVPAARAQQLARQESRSTGRAAGRPQEMGPYAIHALALRLKTENSWREIAMEVNACNHICSVCGRVRTKPFQAGKQVRRSRPRCPSCGLTIGNSPKVKLACISCGDAVRHLAQKYRAILVRRGLFPTVPGRRELRGLSPAEIERLWPPPD